jgi:thiamine biosynthesis lipoprotein
MYTYEIAENIVTVLSHESMATIYELHLIHEDKNYLAQAALEAFNELDQIEQDLSRFIESSDISRINNLRTGESLAVSPHTFSCLKTAIEFYFVTNKIFNIGLGQEINLMKKGTDKQEIEIDNIGRLEDLDLNEKNFSIQLKGELIDIDLGGIGKGYAIDKIKNLLVDWDLDRALIQGGRSTVLTIKAPDNMDGWPVSISFPAPPYNQLDTLNLKEGALSSSGLQKGSHIIDPRTRSAVKNNKATWVIAPSAIVSDILSTTFMILTREEIEEFCNQWPEISYICVDENNDIYRKGI